MLLGLGNNVNGALNLGPTRGHCPTPTDSTFPGAPGHLSSPKPQGADGTVLFHDWTCTVVRLGSMVTAWGNDPVVDELKSMRRDSIAKDPRGAFTGGIVKILPQHDRPAGIFNGGRVLLLCGVPSRSSRTAADAEAEYERPIWDDAAVTDVGVTIASDKDGGVYAFRSLAALSTGTTAEDGGVPLTHPLLDGRRRVSVYTTESRALLKVGDEILELGLDLPGLEKAEFSEWRPSLIVVDELSGLGVKRVVSGKGNRFGVVTDAGEAYLLTREGVERVDLKGIKGRYSDDPDCDPPSVVNMAIGDGFELVMLDPEYGDGVHDAKVYGRGKSEYIQQRL